MSSDDFSQYLTKKPGVFFRLGTRNKEKGITALPHNNDFNIDESALPLGSLVCVQFVLDDMNGIDMKKTEKPESGSLCHLCPHQVYVLKNGGQKAWMNGGSK